MGVGVTGCASTRAVLPGNFLPNPYGLTLIIFHGFLISNFVLKILRGKASDNSASQEKRL